MLIYNYNKEFVGIDQESLNLLGYDRFEALLHEHKDVAELFVKKPGYIHNFTNFPWIDFVLHAESDEAKVIIAGKSKAVTATIEIHTLHLSDAPNEEAFLVKLKNIHPYQLDASERPEPSPTPFTPSATEFNTPSHSSTPEPTPAPEPMVQEPIHHEPAPLEFDTDLFIDEEPQSASTPAAKVSASTPPIDDDLDIFFADEEPEIPEVPEQRIESEPVIPEPEASIFDNIKEDQESTPMLGAYLSDKDREYLENLEFDDNYVYNPQIAADELGLPVDLIEEFIGDFIKQAHEFKDQLFAAVDDEDFDNIKILSHKLKGVAANLRIEDSFELLRTINDTSDIEECKANLKKFYLTIAKLEGKDPKEVEQELEKNSTEELYDLTPKFKDVAHELKPKVEPTLPELPVVDEMPPPVEAPSIEEDLLAPSIDPVEETSPPEPTPLDDDDIYDYGLLVNDDDDDAPLLVMENEEEIVQELENFTPPVEESVQEVETTNTDNEESSLHDLEDFNLEEEDLAEIQDLSDDQDESTNAQASLTFDINTAASEIGLSADLVAALIDDYIVEANEMKSKLNDVIISNDLMRWKGYATQLKGVSDNLRIHEISDSLQHLIDSTDESQAKAAMQEFYGFINQL